MYPLRFKDARAGALFKLGDGERQCIVLATTGKLQWSDV